MSPEEKITKLYRQTDFDKNKTAQNKVYAKINKTPKGLKAAWLLLPAAAILVALVFWPMTHNPVLNTAPHPHENAALTQEECADLSTRYWFEQAAEKGKLIMAKCPKEILNDYNNDLIFRLSQRFEESNQKLSQDEKKKLDDCGEKFKTKVHPVMSFDVRC